MNAEKKIPKRIPRLMSEFLFLKKNATIIPMANSIGNANTDLQNTYKTKTIISFSTFKFIEGKNNRIYKKQDYK